MRKLFLISLLVAGIPTRIPAQSTLADSSIHQPPAITPSQRFQWFTINTVGPPSLAAGVVSAGWGTLYNSPHEYGPHWDGFGQRYGMRLTGVATSNAIEAGLGAIWHEDPRYSRVGPGSFGRRVRHIFVMTFMASDGRGGLMPAYARYTAISGNNFLSNAWREQSEATISRALIRTGLGFLGRLSSNAFGEFWPDVKQRLRRH